jgi:hypothetical protein
MKWHSPSADVSTIHHFRCQCAGTTIIRTDRVVCCHSPLPIR